MNKMDADATIAAFKERAERFKTVRGRTCSICQGKGGRNVPFSPSGGELIGMHLVWEKCEACCGAGHEILHVERTPEERERYRAQKAAKEKLLAAIEKFLDAAGLQAQRYHSGAKLEFELNVEKAIFEYVKENQPFPRDLLPVEDYAVSLLLPTALRRLGQ